MALFKCPECGKEISDKAVSCANCGYIIPKSMDAAINEAAKTKTLQCPKCTSGNVNVQVVAEQKKRGCLMSCVWILLAICTLGFIIWIPLLTKKGSKTKAYAVCQSCGYKWQPR